MLFIGLHYGSFQPVAAWLQNVYKSTFVDIKAILLL